MTTFSDGSITIRCKWYRPYEDSNIPIDVCKTNSERVWSPIIPNQFDCYKLFKPIVCTQGYLTLTWTKYIVYKQYENSKRI
jgi:hypothetical protein